MFSTEFQLPTLLNSIRRSVGGYVFKKGVLVIDVPGFSKDDLEITIENYVLHVKGHKEILGEKYDVDQKFNINASYLDPENPITAKVENGLLFVELKKSEKPKQTKVKIS